MFEALLGYYVQSEFGNLLFFGFFIELLARNKFTFLGVSGPAEPPINILRTFTIPRHGFWNWPLRKQLFFASELPGTTSEIEGVRRSTRWPHVCFILGSSRLLHPRLLSSHSSWAPPVSFTLGSSRLLHPGLFPSPSSWAPPVHHGERGIFPK